MVARGHVLAFDRFPIPPPTTLPRFSKAWHQCRTRNGTKRRRTQSSPSKTSGTVTGFRSEREAAGGGVGVGRGAVHVLHAFAARSLTTRPRRSEALFRQKRLPVSNRSIIFCQRSLEKTRGGEGGGGCGSLCSACTLYTYDGIKLPSLWRNPHLLFAPEGRDELE